MVAGVAGRVSASLVAGLVALATCRLQFDPRLLIFCSFTFASLAITAFHMPKRSELIAVALGLGVGAGAISGAAAGASVGFAVGARCEVEFLRQAEDVGIAVSLWMIESIEGTLLADSFGSSGGAQDFRISPVVIESRDGTRLSGPHRWPELLVRAQARRTFFRGASIRLSGIEPESESNANRRFRAAAVRSLRGYQSPIVEARASAFAAIDRMRSRLERNSRLLFGALFLGIREPELDDLRYFVRRAGCIHLFALSGMHVALLIGILTSVLRIVAGKRGAKLLALPAAIAYVHLIGVRPALFRAAAMFTISNLIGAAGRRARTVDIIAFSLLLGLIVQPDSADSMSLSLTYLAVLGIVVGSEAWTRFVRRFLPPRLSRALGTSLAAYFATAPIVAFAFGETYPFGIVATLLLSPLVAAFLCGSTVLLGVEFATPNRALSFDPIYRLLELVANLLEASAISLSRFPAIVMPPHLVLLLSIAIWVYVLRTFQR